MSYSPISLPDLQGLLVADMDWLAPDLAVGGDLSHDPADATGQAQWLERQGVTDIIDCRGEYSDESLVAEVCPSIGYHHLPTGDHGGQLDADWWDRGIAIARTVVESGGAVFVHCHMGVNRGPSLALAILFDRGMDPLTAFDLLRARRPQAYAIYASQYLRLQERNEDAKVLETFMKVECDHDDLVATIGRIREAESGGAFRFALEPCGEKPSSDTSPDGSVCHCETGGTDRTFRQLQDLMFEYHGFDSTELPVDWVRSLMRQIEWAKEAATPESRSSDLAELDRELEEWLDESADDD